MMTLRPITSQAAFYTLMRFILAEKNFNASKILLALWYLYVMFRNEACRRFGHIFHPGFSKGRAAAAGQKDRSSWQPDAESPTNLADREDFR